MKTEGNLKAKSIANNGEEALSSWNAAKDKEKASKDMTLEKEYLMKAFDEAKELIEVARA